MERLLEILQKLDNYKREGTYFALKQFHGTQKATDWMLNYETEWEKFKIQIMSRKSSA